MGWNVKVHNATDSDGFQAVTVDAVMEGQSVSLAPGATGTLSGDGSGRMTLNAHSADRTGVASASQDINVLGDFTDFTCKVLLPTGTALKLQVASE